MTATTIPEFFRIIRAYWYIGNHETQALVRQIIMWGLGGGALLVCVSFLGIPGLTAIVALALILGGPTRVLWKFSYPLSVPIGAIALPKIDEEAWELVKRVCVWALQALAIFGVFALYFSSPLSPLANLSFLERISVAPVLVLAFVVAGLCALVGWRQQGIAILAVTAAFSLVLRAGGWDGFQKKLEGVAKQIERIEGSAPITLGFGSGRINIAPGTREIVVMVPPGDWTMGVPRPQGATCFWAEPNDTVEIAKYYADGTSVWLHGLQPYMKVPDTKEVTEMRFRNSSHSEAVRVRIQFKG